MTNSYTDALDEEDVPEGIIIDVQVKRQVKLDVSAKVKTSGHTITARSMATGLKLSVKKDGSYYASDITIPYDIVTVVGDVFNAVKAKKEEEEANGN